MGAIFKKFYENTYASITCFYIYINVWNIDITFQTYFSCKNEPLDGACVGQQVDQHVTRLAHIAGIGLSLDILA